MVIRNFVHFLVVRTRITFGRFQNRVCRAKAKRSRVKRLKNTKIVIFVPLIKKYVRGEKFSQIDDFVVLLIVSYYP